jgi:23S rRNA pseudouridine1911/1915/1917 synthase
MPYNGALSILWFMKIVYEDNHIIVLVKPAGIATQADASGDADLLSQIKSYRRHNENKPGDVFVGLVHRLDRMVGGIMIFAKTSKAAGRLSEQVRSRNMRKQYLAIVRAEQLPGGVMEDYLVKDPDTNISKVVHPSNPAAKIARLKYRVISVKDDLTLVNIELETGRSHQIRVQFASRGWPLVGDVKYGTEKAGTQGPALWAYAIGIEHPTTKEKLEFAELPHDRAPWASFKEELLALQFSF